MDIKHPKAATDIIQSISSIKPQTNNSLSFLRRIRKDLGAFLEYVWELSGSLRLYEVDVVTVVGTEKHTNQRITTFYMGHYDNFDFILDLIYSKFDVIDKYKGINSIYTKKWITRYENCVDLLFVDVELLFCQILPRNKFLEIPQWVRQKFDIPMSWQEVLNKFRKNTKKTDLRKVRKYNFTIRLTDSEEDFRDFYHRIYVPYLTKRFENAVIIEPEWKVMRQCKKGQLLQIIRENEVVACALLHNLAGRMAYVWAGVPDHVTGDMFNGAFSALYYFTTLLGYEHGCDEIDFLGSRPLLNDGLFRYKRKWGTYVEDSPVPRGDILLKPLTFSAPIRSFFANNYFITREGKDLVGNILLEQKAVKQKDLEDIIDYYYINGLKHIKIFSCNGFNADAKSYARSKAPEIKLLDISESTNPEDAFCCL